MNLLDANDRPGADIRRAGTPRRRAAAAVPAARGEMRAPMSASWAAATPASRRRWHLAQAGLDVVLLEAQRVGFGASGRNGGQVGTGQRVPQDALERIVGRERGAGALGPLR